MCNCFTWYVIHIIIYSLVYAIKPSLSSNNIDNLHLRNECSTHLTAVNKGKSTGLVTKASW